MIQYPANHTWKSGRNEIFSLNHFRTHFGTRCRVFAVLTGVSLLPFCEMIRNKNWHITNKRKRTLLYGRFDYSCYMRCTAHTQTQIHTHAFKCGCVVYSSTSVPRCASLYEFACVLGVSRTITRKPSHTHMQSSDTWQNEDARQQENERRTIDQKKLIIKSKSWESSLRAMRLKPLTNSFYLPN